MATGSSDLAKSKQTMEALGDFLLNTKRAVENLFQGHTRASMEAFQQWRPEKPSGFSELSASGKGFQRSSADEGRGKTELAQSWPFPYTSACLAESIPQNKTNFLEKAAPVAYRSILGKELEHAVGLFIKDIKKTVDAWCSRYHMLADGKVAFMPQPLHTGMEVMAQLHYDANQDFSSIAGQDASQAWDSEVLHPCAQQNGKQMGMPFVKHVMGGNRRKVSTSRTNRSKARAPTLSLQGMKHTMEIAHDRELSQEDVVPAQEHTPSEAQSGSRKINMNHTSEMEEHGDHNIVIGMGRDAEKASTNDDNLGERITGEGTIVKFGSLNDIAKKATDDTESPVETDELTIRRYQYKVEVVESPDWLPKGWITELKTRGFGGSAGCKDKYYYDPISKRRCRSQKEVFCFIETGKLGRYKKRTKLHLANSPLGVEEQVNITEREASDVRMSSLSKPSAQDNMPSPLAGLPGSGHKCMVGSTFLPYRPGQTSGLLNESMASVSRSSMDQFRLMDPSSYKLHEYRNSASRTWFLSNAEGSARPFLDRFEAEKIGMGGGRRRIAEGAPKRPKKPSKRSDP